jgi:hypothetical protein
MNTPSKIKPLKVWFDENGERHQKYDRAELFSFVQAHRDEEIASVVNAEGEEIGLISPKAFAIYFQL